MKLPMKKYTIILGMVLLFLFGCSEALGVKGEAGAKQTEKPEEFVILEVASYGKFGDIVGGVINHNGTLRLVPLDEARFVSKERELKGQCVTAILKNNHEYYYFKEAVINSCTPNAQ